MKKLMKILLAGLSTLLLGGLILVYIFFPQVLIKTGLTLAFSTWTQLLHLLSNPSGIVLFLSNF